MKLKKGSKVKEPKDAEIQKLKNKIRRLEKEKKELISKLSTLEQAFEKNIKVLNDSFQDISLEELLEKANNSSSENIKKDIKCPKCRGNKYKKIGQMIMICEDCKYREKIK